MTHLWAGSTVLPGEAKPVHTTQPVQLHAAITLLVAEGHNDGVPPHCCGLCIALHSLQAECGTPSGVGREGWGWGWGGGGGDKDAWRVSGGRGESERKAPLCACV